MIENKVLREQLIEKSDFKEAQVDEMVKKINTLSPEIYAAFEEWFQSGKIKDIEIEGYTVESLRMKNPKMNPIAAYLTLDWLKREPVKAKIAIEQPHIEFGFKRT